MNRIAAVLIAALSLLGAVAPASAAGGIIAEDSIFAVVTRKGGFAAALAHDHLIAAGQPEVTVELDPEEPLQSRMTLRLAVDQLVVDDPHRKQRWGPRLVELGLLDKLPADISDKDRAKIRTSMLGRSQLDAASHPNIAVRVVEVRRSDGNERTAFPFDVGIEMTVRGTTVARTVQARYQVRGQRVTVEAFGAIRFSDFGIKPYSAMLGAVRNRDELHLYLSLSLSSQPAALMVD